MGITGQKFGGTARSDIISCDYLIVGGSSNGRTAGFGPAYWGSNPYPPATLAKEKCIISYRKSGES